MVPKPWYPCGTHLARGSGTSFTGKVTSSLGSTRGPSVWDKLPAAGWVVGGQAKGCQLRCSGPSGQESPPREAAGEVRTPPTQLGACVPWLWASQKRVGPRTPRPPTAPTAPGTAGLQEGQVGQKDRAAWSQRAPPEPGTLQGTPQRDHSHAHTLHTGHLCRAGVEAGSPRYRSTASSGFRTACFSTSGLWAASGSRAVPVGSRV